jgi:hypothetical protein
LLSLHARQPALPPGNPLVAFIVVDKPGDNRGDNNSDRNKYTGNGPLVLQNADEPRGLAITDDIFSYVNLPTWT